MIAFVRPGRCYLWSTLLALSCAWPVVAVENTPENTPPLPATVTADAVQEAFVRAAERIKPSIVTIYAERTDPSVKAGDRIQPNPDNKSSGLGTGMVVDSDGAILTNYHVVKEATSIHVLFNADSERPIRLMAKLSGFDAESDLAVLELVNKAALNIPVQLVEFADSDAVRVGEWAIAVGAPFDQAQTITVGIVSAKGRHLEKADRPSLQEYLQTDASINPGNSGGPLLNLQGKVIGINTAILSPSQYNVGIGFALPANTARDFWPRLKQGKSIERGFLGIRYLGVDEEVARAFKIAGGMQIGALAKNGDAYVGPAHAAGLKEGDIITHVDGQSVTTIHEFRRVVANRLPGTNLMLSVIRPESPLLSSNQIPIVLGDWPAEPREAVKTALPPARATTTTRFSRSGLLLEDAENLTESEREEMDLSEHVTGAVIISVLPGSPADKAQLWKGLIIERIRLTDTRWYTIANKKQFLDLEMSLASNSNVLLIVRDKNKTRLYKNTTVP